MKMYDELTIDLLVEDLQSLLKQIEGKSKTLERIYRRIPEGKPLERVRNVTSKISDAAQRLDEFMQGFTW